MENTEVLLLDVKLIIQTIEVLNVKCNCFQYIAFNFDITSAARIASFACFSFIRPNSKTFMAYGLPSYSTINIVAFSEE